MSSIGEYILVNNGSVAYNDNWDAYEVIIGDKRYLVKGEQDVTEPEIVETYTGYRGEVISQNKARTVFKNLETGQIHDVQTKQIKKGV